MIRRGKVVGKADPAASASELAALMVGRSVSLSLNKDKPKLGEETFKITDLSVLASSGQLLLDSVSFGISAG